MQTLFLKSVCDNGLEMSGHGADVSARVDDELRCDPVHTMSTVREIRTIYVRSQEGRHEAEMSPLH
jgi:hypothetical protein